MPPKSDLGAPGTKLADLRRPSLEFLPLPPSKAQSIVQELPLCLEVSVAGPRKRPGSEQDWYVYDEYDLEAYDADFNHDLVEPDSDDGADFEPDFEPQRRPRSRRRL